MIVLDFKRNNYSIPLLCGPSGVGKSMISILISKALLSQKNITKVTLCDTFNPADPGDSFSKLYNKVSPTENKPLVVVLEEIDILISKIHDNKVVPHKDNPILIKNKCDWNTFMDRFDKKVIYPYVILMMTTNKSLQYFSDMDESYMRKGRTTMTINM